MASYGYEPSASSSRQLILNFGKAIDEADQRRAMIDSLPLPGRSKRLLAALDDVARSPGAVVCITRTGKTRLRVTRARLAALMGVSETTVARARRNAERTAFVRLERPPGEMPIWVIDWPAIWGFWANEPRPRIQEGTEMAPEGHQKGTETILSAPTKWSENQGDTPPENQQKTGGCPSPDTITPPGSNPHRHISSTGPRKNGVLRWPSRIEPADLASPERVDRLFRIATSLGYVGSSTQDRIKFFSLARRCSRRSDTPGAAFTSNVKFRRWHLIAGADEDWARHMITGLDRSRQPEIAPALVGWARGVPAEQRKSADEQRAALARFSR